ncbi:MAG TPA: glycosyltransferase [Opitutaceae bacterium]|jgi:glycosyltransferase involved in cell wall biosynthesis|nr:glycosyltransferase [Opitutaceae bacterium]
MAQRKKIVFFLPSLGGGGAEMHLLRILNHGAWETLDPHLILARRSGAYEPALEPRIKRVHLLPRAVKSSTLSLLLACWPLRKALRELKPAVVCSLLNHATVAADFALGRGGDAPAFLIGLQNNVTRDLAPGRSVSSRWFKARVARAFGRADHFVALSHGVAGDFRKKFGRPRRQVSVIYNAGFDAQVLALSRDPLGGIERPPGRLLVACGRLTAQKNFPALLRAVALVRTKMPVTLWILGQGELRSRLESLVRELGLADAVRFLGFQPNPFKYIAQADAFVLSSDWEGFGNVIVEAMALGVPVISTACPFGPPEIITSGENGLLAPVGSVESLADAIVALCTDREFADRLGRAGKLRADDFRAERIAGQYEQLLNSLANGVAPGPALVPSSPNPVTV